MNPYPHNTNTIKSWAEADRPREKMIRSGPKQLSTAELLAILLGSGNREMTAVDLARFILKSRENNLNQLAKCQVKDLTKFKGVGEAKAVTVVAAMELGRRRKNTEFSKKQQITTSFDAFQIMAGTLQDLAHEEFWIVLLNRGNRVQQKIKLSTGGIAGTIVDVKMIMKTAIDHLSSSIILYHNHPSGNLNPSQQDIHITDKLVEAAKLLDIKIIDHIIIAENQYYSFLDEGRL